ncbi:MAG TPA: ABC transporter ATP-binding protein [Bacteroidota bacterium]|nr:ABC transporter ATP-binding protein [Bacteroidota bacterium]
MIRVRNLSKVFKLPHARKKTLFHNIVSLASERYEYEELYALRDISFDVGDGEFVGVIGRNGSGKSTLLRILARIYQPTSGSVEIRDEIYPLLELGVGFQMDFTVRDNIYLYGSLLGRSRKEMDRHFPAIMEFSELERFADARLEKLSTGMQMRLGFAIAIQSTAPIMLVDEVLAVGDSVFSEKCRRVFWNFKQTGKTILLVSHDMGTIREYCNRVLLMDGGRLIGEGQPDAMIGLYHDLVNAPAES